MRKIIKIKQDECLSVFKWLNAPGDVVITGPFEVKSGSSLQVK